MQFAHLYYSPNILQLLAGTVQIAFRNMRLDFAV